MLALDKVSLQRLLKYTFNSNWSGRADHKKCGYRECSREYMHRRSPKSLKGLITKQEKNEASPTHSSCYSHPKNKIQKLAQWMMMLPSFIILQQHLIKVEIKCNYSWYKINLTALFQPIFLAQIADSRMLHSWQFKSFNM